jgi:hypothetical protein
MRRVFTGATLAGVLLVLGAQPCWACSCASWPPRKHAKEAEVIFTGTALGTEVDGYSAGTTTFQVDIAYKGPVAREMAVGHVTQEPACGLVFSKGQRYTVFADADKGTGSLGTNLCMATRAGDIDASRYGLSVRPIRPSVTGSGGELTSDVWAFWLPVGALVGAVILIGGGVGLLARRSHRNRR